MLDKEEFNDQENKSDSKSLKYEEERIVVSTL